MVFNREAVGFLAASRMSWTLRSSRRRRPLARIPTRMTPLRTRAWDSDLSKRRHVNLNFDSINKASWEECLLLIRCVDVIVRSTHLLLQQRIRHQFERALRMRHDSLDGLKLLLHGVDGRVFGHDVAVVGRIGPSRGLKINRVTLYNLIKIASEQFLSLCVLTNRGDTGMLARPMRGGGAILCLISPQYSCSSSILCQYMSSSYLLLEDTWKCAHKLQIMSS